LAFYLDSPKLETTQSVFVHI